MMRNKASNSMQKTYDEAYLACSTAVFFESQNNEAEALRSWRSALDQLYFFNAYRLPSNYTPKSETEKALFDSIKKLELQCKERVDLLDALRRSRAKDGSGNGKDKDKDKKGESKDKGRPGGWLGQDTVPPLTYSDLPNASPSLPSRPSLPQRNASDGAIKRQGAGAGTAAATTSSILGPPPLLPVPQKLSSRSPSPENRKAMRTTLRTADNKKKKKKTSQSSRPDQAGQQHQPPAPAGKAAGLAWDTRSSSGPQRPESDPTLEARLSATAARRSLDAGLRQDEFVQMPDPQDYYYTAYSSRERPPSVYYEAESTSAAAAAASSRPPAPPPHLTTPTLTTGKPGGPRSPPRPSSRNLGTPGLESDGPVKAAGKALGKALALNKTSGAKPKPRPNPKPAAMITRKPVASQLGVSTGASTSAAAAAATLPPPAAGVAPAESSPKSITPPSTSPGHSDIEDKTDGDADKDAVALHEARSKKLLKNLPRGIDLAAARSILNEVIVRGDEVHWDDVAGLDVAKTALKEAVVYPFLRPDLFMGLREPARGMLLFGPPGTGKTMLARAVATESKSTFFAISASSLTSKWHGESEKLVRALFSLAKVMSPSIIFVDEIDSLLSKRGDKSEHEASRRSKTEFLIQWSDLQKAAAGKEPADKQGMGGDASRVLVLAATNCPWDIDDAARRRFVRRQYIPLPEADTREKQLRTLIGHQKHDLSEQDIQRLVELTDGYSGSDITALAKDAAMGPLRNLGEALLFTPPEKIRAIQMVDFEKSLESIRPSVSKHGLEEFDKWAREFGERAG